MSSDPDDVLERSDELKLLSTAHLMRGGATKRQIQRGVQEGALIRIRRGIFAPRTAWESARPEDRHAALVRATLAIASRDDRPVSHLSAAALHGLPIVGRVPAEVHLWDGTAGGGSSAPGLRTHRGGTRPDTVEIDGLVVTSLARTVVDVASTEPFVTAVCVLDAALRRSSDEAGDESEDESAPNDEAVLNGSLLAGELARAGIRRGQAAAMRAIEFADPRSGSAGESLSRAGMYQLGFEVPELQVRFERRGRAPAEVDYFWRSKGIIGEFDGVQKYVREEFLRGRDPADVVVEEKLREDELRNAPGVRGFVRWDWTVARSPRRLAAVLGAAGVPRV